MVVVWLNCHNALLNKGAYPLRFRISVTTLSTKNKNLP
ncbi:hypothetical protein EVA_22467 [gut metagenome]|uniref:Uncharacterized protein n=1 Tax=gut metagenome TaxID=749906 RepID=J9F3F7_9ZZZZ